MQHFIFPAEFALFAFAGMYLLWIFYLAVMTLYRARGLGTLSRAAYAFGLPLLYIGLLIDFLVNALIVSWVFFEAPEEWTVSARLSRHIHDSDGWRKSTALWIGKNLLDAFDPSGTHLR